jgi:hypothetical protein
MEWPTSRVEMLDWLSGWRGAVSVLLLVSCAALIVRLLRKSKWRDTHKRGSRVAANTGAWRKLVVWTRAAGETPIWLAGVAIEPRDETKHFKLIGTTGTGKSTAIRELLRCALERGDRAVITDPDCGYLLSFYDRYRGDVVLNPFETEAMKWDPFAEIHELYDIDQLAGGLIPATEDPSG